MRTLLFALLSFATPAYAEIAEIETPAEQVAHDAEWRAWLTDRRMEQIKRIRQYARDAEFPVNDFQPGFASMLLDANGRPCAMASLVVQDGHGDLIASLAVTDNALQFGDLTGGPLQDWILTSGLTQEEAAFVQEPDFFVQEELPTPQRRLLTKAEKERLRAHFLAAAAQLEAYGDTSLDTAMSRLGERVYAAPPA